MEVKSNEATKIHCSAGAWYLIASQFKRKRDGGTGKLEFLIILLGPNTHTSWQPNFELWGSTSCLSRCFSFTSYEIQGEIAINTNWVDEIKGGAQHQPRWRWIIARIIPLAHIPQHPIEIFAIIPNVNHNVLGMFSLIFLPAPPQSSSSSCSWWFNYEPDAMDRQFGPTERTTQSWVRRDIPAITHLCVE